MRRVILIILFSFPLTCLANCWERAGAMHGIDPLLLKAIAWKESRGNPQAVGPKLSDGNVALGLMQINTTHLKTLKQFGIEREQLFDACISQKVGAWILADCVTRFGLVWKAVGCYFTGPNSSNVTAQLSYVSDVQKIYAGYQSEMTQSQLSGRKTHENPF